MLLLIYVPDWALQTLCAPDLLFCIVYSVDELSGRPGVPEYTRLQWQVYFLLHEVIDMVPATARASTIGVMNFMYAFLIWCEDTQWNLIFKNRILNAVVYCVIPRPFASDDLKNKTVDSTSAPLRAAHFARKVVKTLIRNFRQSVLAC